MRPSHLADAFTSADRRRLTRALRAATHARVYRRLEAVLLVAEGASCEDAARQVRTARRTVERWAGSYLAARDPAVLDDHPRSGRPRVAALSKRQLVAALRRDPRTLGYRATTWTAPLLASYCAERFHCPLSPRTLRRRLHEWGYRWKRPRYVYSERATHLAQKKGLFAVA